MVPEVLLPSKLASTSSQSEADSTNTDLGEDTMNYGLLHRYRSGYNLPLSRCDDATLLYKKVHDRQAYRDTRFLKIVNAHSFLYVTCSRTFLPQISTLPSLTSSFDITTMAKFSTSFLTVGAIAIIYYYTKHKIEIKRLRLLKLQYEHERELRKLDIDEWKRQLDFNKAIILAQIAKSRTNCFLHSTSSHDRCAAVRSASNASNSPNDANNGNDADDANDAHAIGASSTRTVCCGVATQGQLLMGTLFIMVQILLWSAALSLSYRSDGTPRDYKGKEVWQWVLRLFSKGILYLL